MTNEEISELVQLASSLLEVGRKDLDSVDALVEASVLFRKAADGIRCEFCTLTEQEEPNGMYHLAVACYYDYEAERCQGIYWYEKHDVARASEYFQLCAAHNSQYIERLEDCIIELPKELAESAVASLQRAKFTELNDATWPDVLAARAALDEERFADAIDRYISIANWTRELIREADHLSDPGIRRITVANYLTMMANRSQALLATIDETVEFDLSNGTAQISNATAIAMINHAVEAYRLGREAFSANPEQAQYLRIADHCRDHIESFLILNQTPEFWLTLLLSVRSRTVMEECMACVDPQMTAQILSQCLCPPTPNRGVEINEHEFQSIISTLCSASGIMERSPKAFAELGEELLRFHLMVALNARQNSVASGETFNHRGKTDIFLRVGDKDVFIAECKIWKGAKSLVDATGQLLEYLTWRDRKAALVFFSHNKNFTNVLEQIQLTMQSHERFRTTKSNLGETVFHYEFVHPRDDRQVVTLAVVVINLHC